MDEHTLMRWAQGILTSSCEENRHREAKIMQGIDGEKEHAEDVLSWVERLEPKPSIALKIAALFHDIDRVVTPGVGGGFKGDRKSKEYQDHKKAHAKRSADFICTKLMEYEVDAELIERVRFLISHHDDVGAEVDILQDHELDILVAADSLAFFSSIAPRLYETEGEERLRDKVRFMVGKMPTFARQLLTKHSVGHPVFDRVKEGILAELGDNRDKDFETLSTEVIFRDEFLGFRVDTVRTPEGEIIKRKVVDYRESAAVVAFSATNQVLLLKHFRYPVGTYIWDIPGGMLQNEEEASVCVLRELREETGYNADRIEHLLSFYPEPAFTTQILHLFVANGIHRDPNRVVESEIREVQFFDLDDALKMIASGKIKSSWSIIGILLAIKTLASTKQT